MNMTEDQLFRSIKPPPLKRGGEYYFAVAGAFALIEECNANDIAVIGIEAFRVTSGAVEPDLGLIADFSPSLGSQWSEVVSLNNRAAKEFLTKAPQDLLFTVVLCTSNEYSERVPSYDPRSPRGD
jgi:hypothetical protein